MKKIISILLCLLMVFSLGIPAFAVGEELPTIYVTGAQTNELHNADGSKLYPIEDDVEIMDVVKEVMAPCLEKLAVGMVTGDYKEYGQELYNAIVPYYGALALDKNGEVSDGSHPQYTIYNCNVPKKSSGFGVWDYRFWYDWRISPIIAAEELKIYIDMVKEATGKSKVNLLGRCYGANVIASYLEKYKDHAIANVEDVGYQSSSVLGIDLLGAVFSGEIELDPVAIDNFVNFFMENKNLIEDEGVKALILTSVELFSQIKVLGLTGDALEKLIDALKEDVIPIILRDTFGSLPSYWSMTTPETYEKARDFVFKGCEDEYAKLIEKNDDYYYNVQLKSEKTMVELKQKGINFHFFVKYDFPDYPVYENATCQGDGTTAAVRQAFGGEYADYGTVFSDKYINSLANKKYLSPDNKINAESCLFPENTWFIKGIHHDTFPYNYTYQAMEIMNKDLDVSNGTISQFQTYIDGKCSNTEGVDEDSSKPEKNPFASLIRFFTSIFNFLKRLFSGELSFGN